MSKQAIKKWDDLEDRVPSHAIVADVDLVVVRYDESVSVLLNDMSISDLTTFKKDMADLTGVAYGGVSGG